MNGTGAGEGDMLGGARGALCRLLLLAVTAVPMEIAVNDAILTLEPASVRAGGSVVAHGTRFDDCYPYVSEPYGDGSESTSPSQPPHHGTYTGGLPPPPGVAIRWDGYAGNKILTVARPSSPTNPSFTVTVPIPADVPAGRYTLVAECDGPEVNGEHARAPLVVTAPPPPPSSTRPPPPSPTRSSATQVVPPRPPPTVTVTPTPEPTAVPVPQPTAESSPLGWFVVLAVVAALVAGTVLGRRVTRRGSPVVHARLRASGPARVELRRRGADRSVGIRVEVHEDAGTRVMQRIGEGSRR